MRTTMRTIGNSKHHPQFSYAHSFGLTSDVRELQVPADAKVISGQILSLLKPDRKSDAFRDLTSLSFFSSAPFWMPHSVLQGPGLVTGTSAEGPGRPRHQWR